MHCFQICQQTTVSRNLEKRPIPTTIQTFVQQSPTRSGQCSCSPSSNISLCSSSSLLSAIYCGSAIKTSKNSRRRRTRRKQSPGSGDPNPHQIVRPASPVCSSIQPIRREVKPWRECKSSRGRKKLIRTQGHACPNPDCRYFGITDEAVHALVGNGKRGKQGHIQSFKCQCCQTNFSSRRNTPLYHLKTQPDRIEVCLWLLAEGMDISVLVRFHRPCGRHAVPLADPGWLAQ